MNHEAVNEALASPDPVTFTSPGTNPIAHPAPASWRCFVPLLVTLVACGSLTPRAYCEDTYDVTCKKAVECDPTHTVTYDACIAQDRAEFDCSTIVDAQVCNGQGSGHFDGNAASQCLHDIQALTCATVQSTGFILPSTCESSSICH